MRTRGRSAGAGVRLRGRALRACIWPLLILASLGILAAGRLLRPQGWQDLAPGLAYQRIETVASEVGDTAWLHVLRMDPARYRLRLLRAPRGEAATVREMAARERALAAINGGFFDEALRPLGLRVSGGQVLRPLRRANWGVFLIRGGKPAIVHTRDYTSAGVTEALQCGPRLVVAGEITRLKKQYARRACVGIDRAGRVLLVVTDGSTMDATYLARLLRAPEGQRGLDCRDALNLDGGGSAQFYAGVRGFRLDVPGAWPVPDALGVFPR